MKRVDARFSKIHWLTPFFQKKVEDIAAGTLFKPTVAVEQTRENNNADQLTGLDSSPTNHTNYTYDEAGCLTSSVSSVSSVVYEYNQANRLIRVDSGDSWAEYIYDASGARIARIHDSVTNYFVLNYSDPLKRPLAETDGSGNITRFFVWGPSGLLAHIDPPPSATPQAPCSIRYYHADELGSTLALTDENGVLTDEFGYTPYGEQMGHIGSTQTPYRWLAGLGVRVEDEATQLFYMNRRYYSASLKRFLTRDPSGLDGGPNAYLYASANPLFFVDPSGLCSQSFNLPSDYGSSSFGNSFAGVEQLQQDYHDYQMQNNAAYYDQHTYAQSSYQYSPSTVSYASSSYSYAPSTFSYANPSASSYQAFDNARIELARGNVGGAIGSVVHESVGNDLIP